MKFLLNLIASIALLAPINTALAEASASPKQLVFFGDSLTEGFGLNEIDSYPSLLGTRCRELGIPVRIINAGISGDTTAGGLRRIDWTLRTPVNLLVLALGANDGLRGLSLEKTEENLEKIIERVRIKNPKADIVLAGMMVPPNMGIEYADNYKQIFPRVAKKMNAYLIPFLLEGVAGEPDLNLPDGIHPNAKGAKIVAENVWRIIEPLLGQRQTEDTPALPQLRKD